MAIELALLSGCTKPVRTPSEVLVLTRYDATS